MAFIPKHIKDWKLRFFPKKTSTALTNKGAVIHDTSDSGRITVAATTSTFADGILQKTVAATDADYAAATEVPYLVPLVADPIVVADVSTTVTPGLEYDFASGGASVNQGATTYKPFKATKSLSTTKAEGVLKFVR